MVGMADRVVVAAMVELAGLLPCHHLKATMVEQVLHLGQITEEEAVAVLQR
jgi:hypothetical protein